MLATDMKQSLLVLLILVLLGAFTTGCRRDKNVATVDGEAISAADFNQYLGTKRTVRVVVQGQVTDLPVSDTLGFQALQDLATQRIVMHMAADEGLLPTDKEVEDEISFKTSLNPRYLTDLKAIGYEMGQIRDDVKFSLCQERLLTRGIHVDESEVDRLIKEHPEQFMQPASADVYQIYVLSLSQKNAVDAVLKSQQSFKAIAAKYNQAPEGEHVSIRIDRLPDSIKKEVDNTPVGGQTDWLTAGGGFRKYFIEGKTEAKMVDMTPERKEFTRRQIALNYGRQANDLNQQILAKLKSSDVVVSDDDPQLKDMWKRMEDRLDKILSATKSGS